MGRPKNKELYLEVTKALKIMQKYYAEKERILDKYNIPDRRFRQVVFLLKKGGIIY